MTVSKPQQSPKQPETPQANKKVVWAVAPALVFFLIIGTLSVVVIAQHFSGDRDPALGLGKQSSQATLNEVSDAVKASNNNAIIDVMVKNANTSGTPFGHSIRVNVLVDMDKIAGDESVGQDLIKQQVIDAIRNTEIKDTFLVRVGPSVDPRIISGDGSAEQPLTSAERLARPFVNETIEIK